MPTRTLYFDESGFTGYNFLDPAQPIFAIASADITEDQAEKLLKESFPRYQGKEFKFSNIWNSNHRRGLLEFASNLRAFKEHSFIYMVDKRFSVLTKIVDYLIEPHITEAGYDFYDDGFCWKYANYIYFGLTQFNPPELLEALLRRYQVFSRNPTKENLIQLQVSLNIMANSSNEKVKVFLEQMALGAKLFQKYYDLKTFRGSNDLQMTAMLAIVSHWRQQSTDDFSIVHDNSSNFLRSREMWNCVTGTDVLPQSYRMGDGSTVEYPLRVTATMPMDSKDSWPIQFCDVLAGLATRHFSPLTSGEGRSLMNDVIDAGFDQINYNGIRPDTIFLDQIPPKKLDGPDIVDQMMEIAFGRNAKRE